MSLPLTTPPPFIEVTRTHGKELVNVNHIVEVQGWHDGFTRLVDTNDAYIDVSETYLSIAAALGLLKDGTS